MEKIDPEIQFIIEVFQRALSHDPKVVFQNTVDNIRAAYGLELTLIEKVRLKECVDLVLNGVQQTEDVGWNYNKYLHGDVQSIFMDRYYGMSYEMLARHRGDEKFKEYLKIIQEQSHLPQE